MDTATITRNVPTPADRDLPYRRIAALTGGRPSSGPASCGERPRTCDHVKVVPWQLCACDGAAPTV